MATILVTGGTGTLGRALVPRLEQGGHQVRVLSRKPGEGRFAGDLTTGQGLAEASAGADLVVHAAGEPAQARQVDVDGTRRLLDALRGAVPRHLLYVSIVGVEVNPYSYYRAKLAAEELVRAGGVPFTVLRATQFPDLLDTALRRLVISPVVPVPRGWQVQPVDVRDVAGRIAELLEAGPAGGVVEYGGPQVLPVPAAARAWLRARHRRAVMLALPFPGRVGAAFRAGSNITSRADGRLTWAGWLAERYGGG